MIFFITSGPDVKMQSCGISVDASIIKCKHSRIYHINSKYTLLLLLNARLGVKRVTEPNRTEPPDYTGQSLRKFPIVSVPGFTAVTEPNQRVRCVSCLFSIISDVFFKSVSRVYLSLLLIIIIIVQRGKYDAEAEIGVYTLSRFSQLGENK